ncbi:RNA 2',3'-cyclic phosphodiesterase [Fulvimonas soli]|jgi:2'-5' RNA ligase|uniref:RNA 2',3'-cyclic phosphodiesterase n=1 Tax=Fulvimonas soli TaxID=155197 RepID=A0A316I3N1_9GAMM|nr:RNA 2',3'-cyclic phosphodiesterase [Fulvimonas soli]PWK87788.1 2'-5' RNA ligase [Fulvimonas soli]TNY26707.1 2'-5' RNA ligase [Fulvimonas soli]
MPARRPPSDRQPDLLGDAAPPAVHRLFLALMPDAAVRERLARLARALRERHPALRARWVDPARYHATVYFLGDHAGLRADVVAAAQAAMATLRVAPFAWTLDYAASFRGRLPPCVLRGSATPAPLQQLREELRRTLAASLRGVPVERGFTPHVTLAYSRGGLLENTPVEPVDWRVDELALVHSVAGEPHYRVLARRRLGTEE